MYALVLFLELVIAVAMVVFVLLQRSEGGALGMGGGGSGMGGLFSPRGAADTLTRTTTILGALFFVACIGLNLMAKQPTQSGADRLLSAPSSVPVRAPVAPPQPAGPQVPKPQ